MKMAGEERAGEVSQIGVPVKMTIREETLCSAATFYVLAEQELHHLLLCLFGL